MRKLLFSLRIKYLCDNFKKMQLSLFLANHFLDHFVDCWQNLFSKKRIINPLNRQQINLYELNPLKNKVNTHLI